MATIVNRKAVTNSAAIITEIRSGIAATGTTLAGAAPLFQDISIVTAATATTADAVKLPAQMDIAQQILVVNNTAVALQLFPSTAAQQFVQAAAGASVSIPAGKSAQVRRLSATLFTALVG